MISWFAVLLINVALSVVAYMLMPKPKAPQPPELKDMESPTNSAGRPIMVIWGTVRIKGSNILRVSNKRTVKRTYREGGGKK